MKTHMSNTKAKELYLDVMGKTAYQKHQETLNTEKIKPKVVTKRKQEIKIVNNNKKELNQNPKQHVNHLFKNLHQNKYKSTIDNHAKNYESGKKILKDKIKRNRYENAAKKQHERELESQISRVKNCKSLVQRKKDKTDPIVNPTYFMRDNENAQSVTIESYKKTVLKQNRPQSGKNISHYDPSLTYQMPSRTDFQNGGPPTSFGNVPNLSQQYKRPSTAKNPPTQPFKNEKNSQVEGLPDCTFKAILNHIVDNKMWKDTDLKVLYVRLCHRYGQEQVDQIWEMLMDELER